MTFSLSGWNAAYGSDEWDPNQHPRGQPENAGEFAETGSSGSNTGSANTKPTAESFEAEQTANLHSAAANSTLSVNSITALPEHVLLKADYHGPGILGPEHAIAVDGVSQGIESLKDTYPGIYKYVKAKYALYLGAYDGGTAVMATVAYKDGRYFLLNTLANPKVILDRVKDQPRWGVVNRIMMQMPADMSEDDKLATYYKLNMFHEIGHVVDTETDNVLSQRVAQTVMQKVSADKVEGWLDKNISTYATTSAKECLGELVCMMLAGLKTPPEFDFIKATLKKFGQ